MILTQHDRSFTEQLIMSRQPLRLFISYSTKDRDSVAALADDLNELGNEVWYDPELSRMGGQKWWANILSNIRACDLFVLVMTPHSLASEACTLEYRYAYALGKRILPVMLESIDIPTLPPELQELQLVDYRQRNSRQAMALAVTLTNLPPDPPPPDRLPAEPKVPLSPLSRLSGRVRADSMSSADQAEVTLELETLFTNPSTNASADMLLRKLHEREDLTSRAADKIRTLIQDISGPQPIARINTRRPPKSPSRSSRVPILIGAVVALLVVAVGVFAFINAQKPNLDNGVGGLFGPTATPTEYVYVFPTSSDVIVPPTPTTKDTPPTVPPTPAPGEKVVITWFVGLGTGTDKSQLDVQNTVAKIFNASHPDIELKINIAESTSVAVDALNTLIASGNAPDIVGPTGMLNSNLFPGEWLDLSPLVKKTDYNASQFPTNVVNIYLEGGQLLGLPFALYPGLLFYNKDLFDEAGLHYPPTKFGEKYKLDGSEVDWSWDTVATIAKRLTIDKNGNSASNGYFDPSNISQFGFDHQWDTIRSDFQTFGSAPVVNPVAGKVEINHAWRAQAQWMFDRLWVDHTMPNATYLTSDLLKPSAFASGKVAMVRVMLWYTCCLGDLKAKWDLAPVPSYEGTYYAPADADTFRVDKNTKNPDATFTVLTYLLGDAALDLLTTYGAYPARPDLQAQSLKLKADKYPSVTNWDIVKPSFDYGTVPHHESAYPNYAKGQQRFTDFATWLRGDAAKDAKPADVTAQLDKLQSDLQAIVDAGDQPITAPTAPATK